MKKPFRATIVAAIALTASACGLLGNGPADVAKEYVQDLSTGNTKDLNRILYWGNAATASASNFTESEQKVDSLLKAATSRIKSKGGLKSIDVAHTNIYTNENAHLKMAHVKLKVYYNDGSDEQLDIKTVYANDKWLIVTNL